MKNLVKRAVEHRSFAPLVALALGLALVGGRSVASDEAFTWGIVRQPDLSGFWDGLKFVSGNMAAYFSILRFWSAAGDGTIWLRLPSILFNVGTIATICAIGRSWFDRRTASIAGILAATSVPLLYYSIEIRSYAFVAFMATLMWYFLERALRNDRWVDWVAMAVAAGLAVSGHVIMALALPTVGLVALISGRENLGRRIARLIPLGLAVLPSVWLIAIGDGAKTDWIPALSPTSLARAGRLMMGDHAQFTSDGSGFLIVVMYVGLYIVTAVWAFRRRGQLTRPDLLAWLWLVSLPLSIIAVSVVSPLLWHRYLIGALPAGILLISRMLAAAERRQLVVGIVAALAVLGVVRSVALRSHSADEYQSVAELIEARSLSTDSIVTTPQWARAGLDYYWRNASPVVGDPPIGPAFDRGFELGPIEWVDDLSRIWVVDRSDSGQVWIDIERSDSDFDRSAIELQLPSGYVLVEEFEVQRFRISLYETTG